MFKAKSQKSKTLVAELLWRQCYGTIKMCAHSTLKVPRRDRVLRFVGQLVRTAKEVGDWLKFQCWTVGTWKWWFWNKTFFFWVPFSSSMWKLWQGLKKKRLEHDATHWNREPKSNPISLANCHWQHADRVFNYDRRQSANTYRRSTADHQGMKWKRSNAK